MPMSTWLLATASPTMNGGSTHRSCGSVVLFGSSSSSIKSLVASSKPGSTSAARWKNRFSPYSLSPTCHSVGQPAAELAWNTLRTSYTVSATPVGQSSLPLSTFAGSG